MTAAPAGGGGGRVVRAPNHLGDVVMALPALVAADADVVALRWLAPILEMAGLAGRILPFERGWRGWRKVVATLRGRAYQEGVLLSPAFSAAWLFRWGGVGALRGVVANVLVLGGAGERDITRRVVDGAPGSVDAGGATDLPGLAAALSVCHLVVTNDTGPMHLAGAMGTPAVTLWGPSDPGETRMLGVRDGQVGAGPLPCQPCLKNRWRRRGRGTVLQRAHEECMRLITVDQVLTAATDALRGTVA